MLLKKKKYSKPKKKFDKERIMEEEQIKKKFGLKNKKEIWKADARIKEIRQRAKKLIGASHDEHQEFFDRLKKIGLNVDSIASVLGLTKEDYLKRRLQTVLVSKKLTTTPRAARQLITHKKVLLDGKAVNIPSFIVPVNLENKITIKAQKSKPKKVDFVKIVESEEIEASSEEDKDGK